ncbi:hypothetical protein [Caballeronia sp. KNU42]
MFAKHEDAGIGVSASWRDKVFTNAHALMLAVVLSASCVGAQAAEVAAPSPGVDSEQSALSAHPGNPARTRRPPAHCLEQGRRAVGRI